MSRVRVKICGIRTPEEAARAVEAGADALGFNFWPRSARYVEPRTAREIARDLPPAVTLIGVFVNEEAGRIESIVDQVGLHAVQLHGDETPDFCEALDVPSRIRAFRVGASFDAAMLARYPVQAALLDADAGARYGGTGERFDWRVAIEAKRYLPIFLAGGLSPDNVAEAITRVRPYAVDVCSGVEAEPGRKDFARMHAFLRNAALANARLGEES